MKNCPFCKAEIEDNSSFCLYCMTSLEEKQTIYASEYKNKRKIYITILSILLVVLLIIGILAFVWGNNTSDSMSSSATQDEQAPITTVSTDFSTESPSVKTTADTQHHIIVTPTQSKTDSVQQTTQQQPEPTHKETQTPEKTDPPSQSTPVPSNTIYTYRQAKHGDDFSVHYPITVNDIVITGVKSPAPDGTYIIPNTIDGKNVLAISPLAFSDESICNTVKQVIVPSSVKTIWNNAFANCCNMTDIYLYGNSIYIETNAFADTSKRNSTLTIHCSADCQDRNLRYYKNSASNYGAEYTEWNGGELN